MKKSGLADSPFFAFSPAASPQPATVPAVEHVIVPEQANARTGERVNARTPEHANRRADEQANARTGKRLIKRQSYNVYEDQHWQLQQLEAGRALSGNPIPISVMVRQALDDYLNKQR